MALRAATAVNPEGELRVQLRLRGDRVAATIITSTRPDVAAALLRGRTRGEVLAAVPRLFSICARAQSAAAALACTAAAGQAMPVAEQDRWNAAIAAERLREATWQVLLHWPRSLHEAAQPPGAAALAAARTVQAWDAASWRDGPPPWAAEVAVAALGMDAAAWLAIDTQGGLRAWAEGDNCATTRFVRERLDDADSEADAPLRPAIAHPACTLLPAAPDDEWLRRLAAQWEADDGFERQPTWDGGTAETGALSRLQGEPLVRALAGLGAPSAGVGSAGRAAARCVARLHELAHLLAAPVSRQCGALTLAAGEALGWVHSARGLLVHRVRLQAERVDDYRILAPTEWNFHPKGALPQALDGAPATDHAMLQAHAMRLIHSLDPCVACRVETQDA